MKRLRLITVFFIFFQFLVFGEEQEEVDFLLFLPDSGSQFVDQERAMLQLDNIAGYLASKDLNSGQIIVYGYSANVVNEIDPVILSRDRAAYVINELAKRGISKDLFSDPVGYGSVDLWGNNIDENDRSPNRRVRILLDGNIITPEVVQAAEPEPEPEIVISNAEQNERPVPESEKDKTSFKFPLWIFLLIVLIPLLLLLASKRKKNSTEEPKQKPPPIPAAPQEPAPPKIEKPIAIEPAVEPPPLKTVEPIAVKTPAAPAAPVKKVKVLTEEEIRNYAYELFERRNGQHGYNEEDWFQSIRELTNYYEEQGFQVVLYWEQ